VLVRSMSFMRMPLHGAIGSQLNVPTSACWPLPVMFSNVIASS
jgi:hypothetical protein